MPNVLIRGLSVEAVERIDAEAVALGLSRNEYLRRRLEAGVSAARNTRLSREDWDRSAEVFEDLSDPSVMGSAWR